MTQWGIVLAILATVALALRIRQGSVPRFLWGLARDRACVLDPERARAQRVPPPGRSVPVHGSGRRAASCRRRGIRHRFSRAGVAILFAVRRSAWQPTSCCCGTGRGSSGTPTPLRCVPTSQCWSWVATIYGPASTPAPVFRRSRLARCSPPSTSRQATGTGPWRSRSRARRPTGTDPPARRPHAGQGRWGSNSPRPVRGQAPANAS